MRRRPDPLVSFPRRSVPAVIGCLFALLAPISGQATSAREHGFTDERSHRHDAAPRVYDVKHLKLALSVDQGFYALDLRILCRGAGRRKSTVK